MKKKKKRLSPSHCITPPIVLPPPIGQSLWLKFALQIPQHPLPSKYCAFPRHVSTPQLIFPPPHMQSNGRIAQTMSSKCRSQCRQVRR